DSMDICQSVLASFFVRAACGQYELQTPEQLLALLTTMARNKLATHARRAQIQRREDAPGDRDKPFAEVPAIGPTPSKQIASRDLLQAVRMQFSPEERQVAELRQQGKEWTEIAALIGDSAEAVRKRFSRALDRVANDLGLDRLEHE